MKSLFFFLLLCAGALFLGTACERHPASQTIPGYEQQKAAREEAAAHRTIGGDINNPKNVTGHE
ncbi:MAG: hypothetical protein K2W99_05520 [Chthoniobacterales bacterium]|nr:hypothetical protein [Chthoniobacterales bacterium]